MNEKLKELAQKAKLSTANSIWLANDSELERFAELLRQDEREAILCLYSLDGTAADWADKIVARGKK